MIATDQIRDGTKKTFRSLIKGFQKKHDTSDWDELEDDDNFGELFRPLDQIPESSSIEFYQAFDRGSIDRTAFSRRIVAREEQIRAYLRDPRNQQGSSDHKCDLNFRIALFLSCCFVPSAAFVGRYTLGIEIVAAFFSRLNGSRQIDVLGAGDAGSEGIARHIHMLPVIWSLVLHFPSAINTLENRS